MASGSEQPPPIVPRRLMRAAERATLATTLAGTPAWPYASLVLVAFDHDAAPLLLVSDLAEHTKNIQADGRVALLIDGTAGWTDPLAGPRLTLLGVATRDDAPRLKQRFVARHPAAGFYAGFKDFHLYRVTVERGHIVAGFGRIRWVEPDELRVAIDAEVFGREAEPMLETINRAHTSAIDAMGQRLTGKGETGWRITGLDPDGADLHSETTAARIHFDEPQLGPEAAQAALLGSLARRG